MSIVTINDKEYDYDTFTEEQLGLLTEISGCAGEVKRATYAAKIYDARHNVLIELLLKSLDEDSDQTEMSL
tara:strand:+ start:1093 stop:1305 length:213 start_codon:yes stop_codon:yes gene_type:complete